MKYKNTRTGAVIETSGKISGGDWEKIPVAPAQFEIDESTDTEIKEAVPTKKTTEKPAAKTAAKKPAVKKTSSRR